MIGLPFSKPGFFFNFPKNTIIVRIKAEIRKGKYKTVKSLFTYKQTPFTSVKFPGQFPTQLSLYSFRLPPQVKHYVVFVTLQLVQPELHPTQILFETSFAYP